MAASVIAFPPALGVSTATPPLLFLPSTSPLNAGGSDAIIASPTACNAYATLGGATQCNYARAFAIAGSGTYFYLGSAAALGMAPAPACSSS